jgi:lysophospholipase L1-like esterase
MRKTLAINVTIFLILILIIEAIFGYWFKSNNFGIYMRSERNKNELVTAVHSDKKYNFFYKRNFYAFRGKEFNPSNVKIVFTGGSTANQRFTPQEKTIAGVLNSKLKKKKLKHTIYNAATEGKSTRGIVNDFLYWFPKIPNFKPDFFIFYIGLNDRRIGVKIFDLEAAKYDFKFATNSIKKIRDYTKNNSIILEKYKKIENKYFPKLVDVYAFAKDDLYKNFSYTNFETAKKKYLNSDLTSEEEKNLLLFKYRLENLKNIIKKNKFIPIFITQIKFNGISEKKLFLVNQELKMFCKSNNFHIIPLDELIKNMDIGDFFDEVHTSISGSKKIATVIYPSLEKIFNENNY